jgi:hypothetical protein
MKSAALFAVSFLSVSFWLHDSARCQTSLAPRPQATDKGSPPPATTNNVWPPMATDDVPPPTATAKRLAPPMTAKDVPPPAIAKDALPTAAAKDTPPTAIDNVSPTPVIAKPPPSPKPAADYDGFTIGIVDDEETSGQTMRSVKPRPAKQSKLRQEPDSIEGQQSVDRAEDEKLKRKLTICRGCKE